MTAGALAAAGALALALSILGLTAGSRVVSTYFYLPAWWSLLALLEGILGRRWGASDLFNRPRFWLRTTLLSAPAWLIYEAANLRLKNWEYWGVPEALPLRWPGYALAFATVLPAILGFAELFGKLLRGKTGPSRPWLAGEPSARASRLLGLACLLLPLAWPRLFFPLVWAPAFLLLEPWLARRDPKASWLAELAQGRARRFYALLLSGLACGLLWESLNYWAGGKWKYTVPWPREPKLFEMPCLGFLGFPPFALGCASLRGAFEAAWRGAGRFGRLAWSVGLAAFSLAVFRAIDLFTVQQFVRLG